MNRFFRTLFMLLAIASLSIRGQSADQQAAVNKSATSGELFDTIARMDSAIFDAFNGHDVDRLMSMFTDDFEFYHDTGGLTDHKQTRENFKKVFASNPDIRRDLVQGRFTLLKIMARSRSANIAFAIKRMTKMSVAHSSSP
jgi:ketosteroid isomerase-like protein